MTEIIKQKIVSGCKNSFRTFYIAVMHYGVWPSVAQSMPCISFDTLKGHKKRKRLHNLNILKEGIEVARMGKKEKMSNLLIILSA